MNINEENLKKWVEQTDGRLKVLESNLSKILSKPLYKGENNIRLTKEPLIKDEKIRKAVRAWADANDYDRNDEYQFEDFSTGWKSWSLEHKRNGDDNEIHFNGGIDFEKMNHQGNYTIDELCGKEEK